MSGPIDLTDDSFEIEVLKSDKLVLVDFWAVWCGPCRILGPTVEEISKQYEGKLKVGKLNVDDYSRMASQYGIMSIPSLLFFKGGQVVDQLVGAVPKKQLTDKLDKILGKN